jgi:PAS domain S-box-containing protein
VDDLMDSVDPPHADAVGLRQLFDANIVGMVVADADGRILAANDYYLRTLGFTREDLARGDVDWRDVTPPEWRAADEAADAEIAERGTSTAFEKEYLHRDGRRVPVLLASAAVPGEPPGLATFVLDISRLKAAEDALRRGEVRYRQLFEAASEPVFLVDRETLRIVDANELASTLYGYTHEELLERVSPDLSAEPEKTTRFIRGVSAGPGQAPDVHTRLHRRKDGTVFPVEVSARTLDIDGRSMLLVACRDISERAAAERTIRQMAAAMDSAPNGMTVHDPTGRMVYVNLMAARMHGYPREEMVAIDGARVNSPEEAARFLERVGEVRRLGTDTYEVEHIRKDGSTFPLSVTVSSVTWDGRDALLAVSTDITERRAAEAAIRRSAAELEAAQRVAHVGSWTWDPASGDMIWSAEMFRIFGLEPSGRAPTLEEQAHLHPADAFARLVDTLASAARTGATYQLEHDIVRPDGQLRHLAERGEAVRDETGAIIRVRGTIADVTALRQAQARVDQAQRAEMVGRLAGGVAHDFNNLLTAIGGYAELLAASIRPDDPRGADVAAISHATSRAAMLTRQLLAFGRRQTLRPTLVSPGAVVTGLSSMVRSLTPADIAVEVRRGPDDGMVLVDRDHLEQALVNLVLNARDAMPGGGTLTIETDTVRLDDGDSRLRPPAAPGAYIRLTVSDTGTGIAPDVLPHILEPFFTTKPMWEGSGLGLSSVDGFVDQSGGLLVVQTTVGSGSAFSIYLLRADARDGLSAGDDPSGPVILIVDDEPGVRAVAARILRGLGYAVIEAGDAEAALSAFDGGARIDLLVADLVLPGMNGRELARRCARGHPGLAVLLISGYPADALPLPPDDGPDLPFLAKPFTMEALGAHVRRLLDRGA